MLHYLHMNGRKEMENIHLWMPRRQEQYHQVNENRQQERVYLAGTLL